MDMLETLQVVGKFRKFIHRALEGLSADERVDLLIDFRATVESELLNAKLEAQARRN